MSDSPSPKSRRRRVGPPSMRRPAARAFPADVATPSLATLHALLAVPDEGDDEVEAIVDRIMALVRADGSTDRPIGA
jgi:hypothetical protein